MTGSIYTVDPVLPPGTLLQARMRYSCCEPSLGAGMMMSAYAQGDSLWYDNAQLNGIGLVLSYIVDMMYGPGNNATLGGFNSDYWYDFGIGRSPGQIHFRRWYGPPMTTSYGVNLTDDHYIVLGDSHGSTAGTVNMTDVNYDAAFVRVFAPLEPTVEVAAEEDAP
jgi:hypothetical protein